MKNVIEYYDFGSTDVYKKAGDSVNGFPYEQLHERISHWNQQGFRVSIMTPMTVGGVDCYHADTSHDVGVSFTQGLFVCYESCN